MNDYFARQNLLLPPEVGRMIPKTKVLVPGTGAVGNEVSKNLVLMGFQVTNVDFDYVEDSNLSRTVLFRKEDIRKPKALVATERLKEMALTDNPQITGLHGNLMTDFGKGRLFMDHDIVISCVDTMQCRAFISDWCVRTGTPFFEVGAEGLDVNVTFYAPPEGYQQISDGKIIEKLPSSDGFFPKPLNKFTVCLREEIGQGYFDGQRNSCSGFKMKDTSLQKIPTIQTSSAMAAAIVSTELIKYLSGKDTLRNKVLFYYGLHHETLCCSYTPNENCLIHKENIPIRTLEIKPTDTMGDILSKIRDQWGGEPLMHVPSFVFSGHCACCGKKMKINNRSSEIYDDERWCDECRSRYDDYVMRQDYASQWDRTPVEFTLFTEERFLKMHPQEIGIPQDDIVKVVIAGNDRMEQLFVRLKPVLR